MKELTPEQFKALQPAEPKPKPPQPSLLDETHQALLRELSARLKRRPVRFDVNYNSVGKIVSVVPIYEDDK